MTTDLPIKIEEYKIDFVIVNGENAAKEGVGITEEITNDLFEYGVAVSYTHLPLPTHREV